MLKKKSKKVNDKNKSNLLDKKNVNYFDKKKYRAILYNESGEEVAIVKLKKNERVFYYNDGCYNVKFDNETSLVRKNFFNTYKYFYYQNGNPDPIVFNRVNNNFETKFDAKTYNIMMKTKIANDLNNLSNPLSALFTPRNMIIGVIVLAAIGYFLSGGTIS